MHIETEDGTRIDDPSEDALRDALVRLGLPGNGYAILAVAPEDYIQVAGSRADGYVIEYREGSEDTHHSSVQADIPHARMVDILCAYRAGRPWKSRIAWRAGMGASDAGKPRSRAARAGGVRAYRPMIALFILIGAGLLAGAAFMVRDTQCFIARASEVPGIVVEMRMSAEGGESPVVEYVDQGGTPRRLYGKIVSHPPAYREGEAVTVLYDPAAPDVQGGAMLRDYWELWGVATILGGLGAVFCFVSSAFWWFVLRRR